MGLNIDRCIRTCINTVLYSILFFFFDTDLKALVQHISGVAVPRKKSIKIELMEDYYGVIVAATCGDTIALPQGVFAATDDSIQEFCMAMHAVTNQPVGSKSFNTV